MTLTQPQPDSDRQDQALLSQIAERRDRAAMETLYLQYRPRLTAFLKRMTRDEGMIEEAYNDVMLTVWRKAHQFRAGSKVSSWIFSIAYRVCLRMVRKQKFRSGVLEMFGQTQKEPLKGEEAHREDESLIAQALERLSAQHRSIIELAYYCGHSTQEIAEIAGCPVNTVKTRLFHARKKIREFVERNGGLGECP